MKLDLSNSVSFDKIKPYQEQVSKIHKMINEKSGPGNDYLGWADWPINYDILVVCGIGGSYLGARAALEAINGLYSKDKLEVIFMGQTFSPNYIAQVLDYLKGKNFAINVISKSGTTTETSISFRLLKE